MIWFFVLSIGAVVLVVFFVRMALSGDSSGRASGHEELVPPVAPPPTPLNAAASGLTTLRGVVATQGGRPELQGWEREREERKRAREAAIARLRSEFVPPPSVTDAVDGVRAALAALARVRSVPEPDTRAILREVRLATTPAKMELTVRKRLNAAYKLRADPAMLHESLAYCLVQIQLVVEHPNLTWNLANALGRIARNLDHDHYRRAAIGLLLVVGDALRQGRPDAAVSCDEEVARMFWSWWADESARARYQADVAQLERAASASEKHFLINGLVEYLDRCRPFDPSVRSQLVAFCEQDVALYKTFLADFTRDGAGPVSFARAVKSEHYLCPSLPSFNILWGIFEEERNIKQLHRLQKIGREIKYRPFEIDEDLEDVPPPVSDRKVERPSAAAIKPSSAPHASEPPTVPTEVIEVGKSGQSGKLAFLTVLGKPCSTEDAAADYFRAHGWRTLRAEVRFWQAMFGLVFWEEIFAGSGAPNAMNDIPLDLFAGASFYEARRRAIDVKAATIAGADLRRLVADQIRRHRATWTRIVYDAPHGDFSYLRVLESADTSDFLATIPPATFAKIVHRIATNPSEHRAGVADYVMWKGGAVMFVEVKGIREKLRDSQSAWIAWMLAEKIAVKVVRVKGVPTPGSTPSASRT